MMEMADGCVHYGSYPRPLAISPPMDVQSSDEAGSGKPAAKKSRQRGKEIIAASAGTSSRAVQPPRRFKMGLDSSFLKMFVGNISDEMFLPRDFTIEPDCLDKHWFTIIGPSGDTYRVWLESYLDSLVFRGGWSDLVRKEGIRQGDIGLFKRSGVLEFSLILYARGGLEKEPADPAAVLAPPTPEPRWEDVRFVAAQGVKRSTELVSTLFGLWVTSQHPIILYATTIKRSSAAGGPMNLNRRVSARLPAGPSPIGLKFNGSRLIFPGVMVKRPDQLVRIQEGWIDYAHTHKLVVGAVYVFKFWIGPDGWEVTLYRV